MKKIQIDIRWFSLYLLLALLGGGLSVFLLTGDSDVATKTHRDATAPSDEDAEQEPLKKTSAPNARNERLDSKKAIAERLIQSEQRREADRRKEKMLKEFQDKRGQVTKDENVRSLRNRIHPDKFKERKAFTAVEKQAVGFYKSAKRLLGPPTGTTARELATASAGATPSPIARVEYSGESVYYGLDKGIVRPTPPPGFARKLSIALHYTKGNESLVPETLFLEELGGEKIYQIPVAIPPTSDSDRPSFRRPTMVGKDLKRTHTDILVPWNEFNRDFLVYDKLTKPSVLGLIKGGGSSMDFRLYSELEKQDFKTYQIKVTLTLPDGNPAANAYVLSRNEVLGRCDSNGKAEIEVLESEGRSAYRGMVLVAYAEGHLPMELSFPSDEGEAELSAQFKILLKELRVKLPKDLDFVSLSATVPTPYPSGTRYGDAWPEWASETLSAYQVSTESLLFLPNKADKIESLPFIEASKKPRPSWHYAHKRSLAAYTKHLRHGMSEARLSGAIMSLISNGFRQGRDRDGSYRFFVPDFKGQLLLHVRTHDTHRTGAPAELFISIPLQAEARHTTGRELVFAQKRDVKDSFLTFPGTKRDSADCWLRYNYGESGAKARPPLVPEDPTPRAWPTE